MFTSLHTSQRLRLYQIKLHYLRGVWPIVTDVQDNLMNTTTKNSAFLHSLLLTNHFGHFRRHDSKIKRYSLGEIISKRAQSVPQPQTQADKWGIYIRPGQNTFYAFISLDAMGDMTTGHRGGGSNKMVPCLNATKRRQNEKMIGFCKTSEDSSVWWSGEY